MNFSDLNIETKLKKSIELADFKVPTPIQSQSIPISLDGKKKDDLQEAMTAIKSIDIGLPIDFVNFRD